MAKVALFGSYLSATGSVSDIDLFVWIAKKPKFDTDFTIIRKQRTKEMLAEGRRFKNLIEKLHWPELDVESISKMDQESSVSRGITKVMRDLNIRSYSKYPNAN